jgi:hypothetical protein
MTKIAILQAPDGSLVSGNLQAGETTMMATGGTMNETLQVFNSAVRLARTLLRDSRSEDARALMLGVLAAAGVRERTETLLRKLSAPPAMGDGLDLSLDFYENGPWFWEVEAFGKWFVVSVDRDGIYWGGEMGVESAEKALAEALSYQACWPEAAARVVFVADGNGRSRVSRHHLMPLASAINGDAENE